MIIKHGWREYRRMVVPEEAGAEQVLSTESAFYAGAAVVINELLTLDVEDEDEVVARLESIRLDVGNFARLKAGL